MAPHIGPKQALSQGSRLAPLGAPGWDKGDMGLCEKPGVLTPPLSVGLADSDPKGLAGFVHCPTLNLIIPPSKVPLFSLLHKVVGTGQLPQTLLRTLLQLLLVAAKAPSIPPWAPENFSRGYLRQLAASRHISGSVFQRALFAATWLSVQGAGAGWEFYCGNKRSFLSWRSL